LATWRPGTSEMFINHYCLNKLYDSFTIVHWDQRGTALSFNDSILESEVSFDKILDDANQLTETLKARYNQSKIFIIGHSFGSILGLHLAEKYPENYYAYIGVGQVIDFEKSYEITLNWLIDKLNHENDTLEVSKLVNNKKVSRKLLKRFNGIYVGDITMIDVIKKSDYYYEGYLDTYYNSMKFVRQCIYKNPSANEKKILTEINNILVPVYFFEGRYDRITACAPELVVEYLKILKAPTKEIVWFENSAHHPNIDEPDKFQKVLIEKVLKECYRN
jgi:pimeloyl-ACP methyl ester carboxylesterase